MSETTIETAKDMTRTKSLRIQKATSPFPSPTTKGGKPPKSTTPQKAKPKEGFVDYSNCVLSYNCPESKRPGHGIVGDYVKKLKQFVVNFTFLDDLFPKEEVHMQTIGFIRRHVVDADAAQKWIEEVERHKNLDSPITKKRKAADQHKSRDKRKKIAETQDDNILGTASNSINMKPKSAAASGKEKQTGSEKGDSDSDEDALTHLTKHSFTPGGSSITSRTSPQSATKPDLDPGIKALIQHAVREATYAIAPTSTRLRPFMYWNAAKTTSCVKMLIKRTQALQLLADKFPRNVFARNYAKYTKKASNNERSAQIRGLKLVFLNNNSPFCFVDDYKMGGSSNASVQKEMRITSSLREEFESIDDLRDALASQNMYNFPQLFDLFCAGLESGKIRGIPKMNMSTIDELITVPHEAHFRLELWYALVNQAYRHEPSKLESEARHEKHTAFCALVAQDRHENAANAFKHRTSLSGNAATTQGADSSSDDDTGVPDEFY